ncbi:helix-turn-helix domain-containing protein [Agrobacterium sp. rho-8.1]|nr:helix-turn-helix domain-containing protein [Agrobacterium sp. rho-8.1]
MSLTALPHRPEPSGPYRPTIMQNLPLPSVTAAQRQACQQVRQITCNMFAEIVERDTVRRDRRHAMSHIRQISIYVCHVVLSLPLPEVAVCFGRDRSTVGLTCQHVEDRRDDPGFDAFVTAVEERCKSLVALLEADAHD